MPNAKSQYPHTFTSPMTADEKWEVAQVWNAIRASNRHDVFVFMLDSAKEKLPGRDKNGKRI